MTHLTFHIVLEDGAGSAYDRLHDELPASALQQIRDATIVRYRIFRDEVDVFGYLEIEDMSVFASVMKEEPTDPEFRTWAEEVRRLFARVRIDESTNFLENLDEVFSLERPNYP